VSEVKSLAQIGKSNHCGLNFGLNMSVTVSMKNEPNQVYKNWKKADFDTVRDVNVGRIGRVSLGISLLKNVMKY